MVHTARVPPRCITLALALGLAACGSSERPSALPPMNLDVVIVASDVASTPFDVSTFDGGARDVVISEVARDASRPDVDPNRSYPLGPYGGGVGSAPPPFTLQACDGAPYAFGGVAFRQSSATVLALVTGNCPTCEADARALQSIASEFSPRGVRVVEVLLEGAAPMEPPDLGFCTSWSMRANASHPVLIDVSRSLDAINPVPRSFPLVLVADASGVIRARFAMQPGWPTAARAALSMLAP